MIFLTRRFPLNFCRRLKPYYSKRPNKTCDSGMLDTYIWQDYYNIRCATVEDKALLLHVAPRASHW